MLGFVNKLKKVVAFVGIQGPGMWLRFLKLTQGISGCSRNKSLGFLLNNLLSPGGEKTIDLTSNLINFFNLPDKMRSACGCRPLTRQFICQGVKLPAPLLGRELLLEGLRSAMASDPGGMNPTPVMPYRAPIQECA